MLSEQEKRDLALTIAGEIHPGLTRHGTDEAHAEIASILQSIQNRRDLNPERYASLSDVVKEPAQYSTWSDASGRAVAAQNYSQYTREIDEAIDDYFSGKLESSTPMVTNYWSPSGMLNENGTTAPSWAPAITDRARVGPHVFGTDRSLVDDMQKLWIESRIAAPYLGAPVPTGKGVSQSDYAVDALASNTQSPFTSQFAPGQASSMPWSDSFAPAPEYVPSTPAASRFDQTFRRSFPTEPQRPPLTPGTSDTARTAAYRGLADTLAQAGVGGLNGQATPQSREAFDDNGKADVRLDHSPMPEQTEFDEPYAAQDFTVPTPKPAPPVFAAPVPTPAPRNRIGVQDPPTATHPPRSVPIPTPRPTNGQTGNAVLDGRKRVAELLVRRYLSPAGRSMGIEMISPGRKAVARALLKAQVTTRPS
jgi:hypothetical protein